MHSRRRPPRSEADVSRYRRWESLLARRSRPFARHDVEWRTPRLFCACSPACALSLEAAALAFAAGGITGPTLAELRSQRGPVPEAGSGNINASFIGRTVASPDARHPVIVCVLDDDGCGMLKRPQEYARGRWPGCAATQADRVTIPAASPSIHSMNPPGYNAAVLAFLANHGAR